MRLSACLVVGIGLLIASLAARTEGGDWLPGEYHGRISGCSRCGGSLYGAWRCFDGCCDAAVPWGECEAPCCGDQEIPAPIPSPAIKAPIPSPAINQSPQAVPHWEPRRTTSQRPIYRLALPPTYGPYWSPSSTHR